VAYNYIQTWRMRARIVHQAAQILSTEMVRSADSIEYSEQENGILRFKLRAEKLLETKQGISYLEGISAFDANPDGSTKNQIQSKSAQYDKEHKNVEFSGDVFVRLSTGAEIRTQSLRYGLDSGAGEAQGLVALKSIEGYGSARGIKFSSKSRDMELLQEADLTLTQKAEGKDGNAGIQPMRARSRTALFSEETRLLRWSGDVRVDSTDAALSGNELDVRFSEDKKKITAIQCRGAAAYENRASGNPTSLRGDVMNFTINPETSNLESIEVRDEASFSALASEGKQILTASWLKISMDPLGRSPLNLQARGKVQMDSARAGDTTTLKGNELEAAFTKGSSQIEQMKIRGDAYMGAFSARNSSRDELRSAEITIGFRNLPGRSSPRQMDAQGKVRWTSDPQKPADGRRAQSGRSLSADTLAILYSEESDSPQSGLAKGNVELAGIPAGSSGTMTLQRLKADTVRFQFYPAENKLKSFEGDGHVEAQYRKAVAAGSGEKDQEMLTRSGFIRAAFRQADGQAETVSQWRDFIFRDGARTATAGRSDYSAEKDLLTLSESPKISDENGVTTGDGVQLDRKSKLIVVSGHVRSVVNSADKAPSAPMAAAAGKGGNSSIVTADAMQFGTESKEVHYSGNVQLLSENGQLQAQSLTILDSGERVEGEGNVRHLIPKENRTAPPRAAASGKPSQPDSGRKNSILVRSGWIRFARARNTVNYGGGVQLDSGDATLSSETMTAVYSPENNQIRTAESRGKVRIRQGLREATGDAADYSLDSGTFIITGNPATVSDPAQGRSSARRLTIFTADDRILLDMGSMVVKD
jgi:LPS export ABC transporter protein LptC